MCGLQDWPNYQCQLGIAAVSRNTFFKMADNIVSDSDSSWKNVQMKARLILLRRLKGWEEAKIARERKLQTNPAVKTTIKPTSSANK